MENTQLEKLRIAANQFYLNKYMDQPLMEDSEYDSLVIEYESETGQSIKDLVEWEPGSISVENEPEDQLDKIIVQDNDLKSFIENDLKNYADDFYYFNLKYDGGGIKLVYDELGRLVRIQSTPDEKFGIIRTDQFWDLVPKSLNPELGIKCLRGEVLVDPTVYRKLARNKANGLINSTISKDEISQEGFIRIYKITYFDNNWSVERQYKDLKELPILYQYRTRNDDEHLTKTVKDKVFSAAYCFGINEIPTEPIVIQSNEDIFLCDGVVMYHNQVGVKGYKFYYTDSAVTEVLGVQWNQKQNGSYAAVLNIDEVVLDDKYINNVSSNGVPRMIDMEYGKGAIVRVILANTTIPKIIEVLSPSTNFQFPKCKCGYQMSEDDIYGSTLKCGNKGVCCDKVEKWLPECAEWIVYEEKFKGCDTLLDCLLIDPYYIGWFLHIDRWNPDDKAVDPENNKISDSSKLTKALHEWNFETFKNCITEMFEFSDLQYANMEINCTSAFEVARQLLNVPFDELKKKYDL